jgi:hypothetical protein
MNIGCTRRSSPINEVAGISFLTSEDPDRQESMMRTIIKAGIAAATFATVSLGMVQPAQARDNTGVAIAAGIIGLGVGAALVSDRGGYDDGYSGYTNVGYYGRPSYYGGGYSNAYYPSYGYGRPAYRYGYDRGYRGPGWDRGGRDHGRRDHFRRHGRDRDYDWRGRR